jgi:hypothetical protein
MLTARFTLVERKNVVQWCTAKQYRLGKGRAIAQAFSCWLPNAVALVRSCGICGGHSGTGAGFLRVLRLPWPIFIAPIAPQSPSSIIWGWYNRTIVAAVPSGLGLTPLRIKEMD